MVEYVNVNAGALRDQRKASGLQVVVSYHMVLGMNLSLLQEQCLLLAAEPSHLSSPTHVLF